MRRAQGMPVNMIVLVVLAVLVLIVVAIFLISGFGGASQNIQITKKSDADCQSACDNLNMIGMQFGSTCCSVNQLPGAISYQDSCSGQCMISISGTDCKITKTDRCQCMCDALTQTYDCPTTAGTTPTTCCTTLKASGSYLNYKNTCTNGCSIKLTQTGAVPSNDNYGTCVLP